MAQKQLKKTYADQLILKNSVLCLTGDFRWVAGICLEVLSELTGIQQLDKAEIMLLEDSQNFHNRKHLYKKRI